MLSEMAKMMLSLGRGENSRKLHLKRHLVFDIDIENSTLRRPVNLQRFCMILTKIVANMRRKQPTHACKSKPKNIKNTRF